MKPQSLPLLVAAAVIAAGCSSTNPVQPEVQSLNLSTVPTSDPTTTPTVPTSTTDGTSPSDPDAATESDEGSSTERNGHLMFGGGG
jgi:hypothetical protein